MKCIIPAAGFGTRMKEIAANTPKTLLKVKDKAILDHILENVTTIPEITEITIISNAKFYDKFVEWKSQSSYSIPIKIINDGTLTNETRLGGIKDIRLGIDMETDEDYIIVNSDNLFDLPLKKVYNFFKEKNTNVLVVHDVHSLEEIKKFGCVEIDSGGKLLNFIEKPSEPKSTLASTGIYLYNNATIKLWDQYINEGKNLENTGFFMEWVYKTNPVSCYVIDDKTEKWYDIGSIETYKALNEEK